MDAIHINSLGVATDIKRDQGPPGDHDRDNSTPNSGRGFPSINEGRLSVVPRPCLLPLEAYPLEFTLNLEQH
jgi:hypothetical protein